MWAGWRSLSQLGLLVIKAIPSIKGKHMTTVTSRTGVTGSSEWWYTDLQTIEDVFQKLERKFAGESVPYDLHHAFKYEEPNRNNVYFAGKMTYF
jgi:hypothetical protein